MVRFCKDCVYYVGRPHCYCRKYGKNVSPYEVCEEFYHRRWEPPLAKSLLPVE